MLASPTQVFMSPPLAYTPHTPTANICGNNTIFSLPPSFERKQKKKRIESNEALTTANFVCLKQKRIEIVSFTGSGVSSFQFFGIDDKEPIFR